MNKSLTHLLKRAAREIGTSAREIRRSHSLDGKFPREERDAQLEYFRLVALRRELYEAARG